MNSLKRLLYYIALFLIYSTISIKYLVSLNNFNKLIINKRFIEIVIYNDGASWRYCIGALVLILIGIVFIYYLFKYRSSLDNLIDIIIIILVIISILAICVLIIYFIQNPILRAIFTTLLSGGMFITLKK